MKHNLDLIKVPKQYTNDEALKHILTFRPINWATEEIDYDNSVTLYYEDDNNFYVPPSFLDSPERQECIIEDFKYDRIKHPINDSKWNNDYSLYSGQEQPVKDILSNNADIIIAKCGSGKTVMTTNIIANSKLPVCIIVHRTFLAEQWRNEILTFTKIKDESIVLHNNTKYEKSMEADVVICTVQSLINISDDNFYNRFNLAVFDEVHTMGSFEFHRPALRFKCRKVGMTATPTRTDKMKLYNYVIGSRMTQGHGKTIPAKIISFNTDFHRFINESDCYIYTRNGSKMNINAIYNMIISIEQRNDMILRLISDLITKTNRTILLLTHRVNHAKELYEAANVTNKELILGGNNSTTETPSIETRLIIATIQKLTDAFNFPKLDTLIYVTPFTNLNALVQTIGRIERYTEDKNTPYVIDIHDYSEDQELLKGLWFAKHRKYEQIRKEILVANNYQDILDITLESNKGMYDHLWD